MAKARVGDEGIKIRKEKIARWEAQVSVWKRTAEKTPGMEIIRTAILAGKEAEQRTILERVKTLSLSTEADRLDLAKHQGILEAYDSIYYDIVDASKKIEGAEVLIAKLREEIARAKRGELIDTEA